MLLVKALQGERLCLGYERKCEDRVRLLGSRFRRGPSFCRSRSVQMPFFLLFANPQDRVRQVDKMNKAVYCCAVVM